MTLGEFKAKVAAIPDDYTLITEDDVYEHRVFTIQYSHERREVVIRA